MLVCPLVAELLCQAKVYHIHLVPLKLSHVTSAFSALSDIHLLAQSHQEVVRLHVSVDEVLPMDELNPTYELIRQQENRFEAELPVAEVEEVLEAGPQQLHHHHVVLPLAPVVLDKGDAHTSLHHLVTIFE